MHARPRLVLALAAGLALTLCPPASAAVPKLPKRFLWGVSGSGFQSEGHTTGANWNHYIERDSAPGAENPKEPYRNSVDFYRRYRSDIGLAAGLGVNVYRISINWTRVEPEPGKFSESRTALLRPRRPRDAPARHPAADHAQSLGLPAAGSTTRAAGRARRPCATSSR